MKFGAESTYAGGQCGIGIWHAFKNIPEDATDYKSRGFPDNNKYWGWNLNGAGTDHICHASKLNKQNTRGGCGFNGTGFINNELCKAFYEQLCKDFRLVFQTPVRLNKNSDNLFFYAMFDNTEEKDMVDGDLPTLQPKWPF